MSLFFLLWRIKIPADFTKNLSIWITFRQKRQEIHCVSRCVRDSHKKVTILQQTRTWNISMILSGQHSVHCFHYVPMRMNFRINSVPDPWCKAVPLRCLDIFIDKSTQKLIISCPFLQCFVLRLAMILHYKASQWKRTQGCTIFIDSYILCYLQEICEIVQKFVNYVIGCNFLSIMQDRTVAQINVYHRPWKKCSVHMGSWIFYNTVKYYFSSPILLRAFTFNTSVFVQLDINKGPSENWFVNAY